MKKLLIVIGIIILVLMIVIGSAIFIWLNKEKTPILAEDFYSIMEKKGYTMTDATSQFDQYTNYIKKAYIAQNTDYQIEFYELSSEENAISMYNTNKSRFESQKSDSSSYATVSMKNYSTYALTTNGKYKYISRIDNTMIYLDVDEEYKDTIKKLIKEIGY